MSSTPVSIGNGTWDTKVVLGDAAVRKDGSACFTVPARTPVYFQALDEKGRFAVRLPGTSRLLVFRVVARDGAESYWVKAVKP